MKVIKDDHVIHLGILQIKTTKEFLYFSTNYFVVFLNSFLKLFLTQFLNSPLFWDTFTRRLLWTLLTSLQLIAKEQLLDDKELKTSEGMCSDSIQDTSYLSYFINPPL